MLKSLLKESDYEDMDSHQKPILPHVTAMKGKENEKKAQPSAAMKHQETEKKEIQTYINQHPCLYCYAKFETVSKLMYHFQYECSILTDWALKEAVRSPIQQSQTAQDTIKLNSTRMNKYVGAGTDGKAAGAGRVDFLRGDPSNEKTAFCGGR